MVAINFQPWKAEKVESGESNQTIRIGPKGYTGCLLQLYTRQRTKECRLLGITTNLGTEPVVLRVNSASTSSRGTLYNNQELDEFALADGFESYPKMWEWFLDQYPTDIMENGGSFYGWRTWWTPLKKKLKAI